MLHKLSRRAVVDRPIGLWITIAIVIVSLCYLRSTSEDLHDAFQVSALNSDMGSLRHEWTLRAGKASDTDDLCAALRLAVCLGHESVVAQLLDWKVDPNCRSPRGRTPLMLAVGKEHSPAMARRLLAAGADVNATDMDGSMVLKEATEQHDQAMLEVLRGKGL